MPANLKMPSVDVNLHILQPGHILEKQKGKRTDLSIRSTNGTARLGHDAMHRINKVPAHYDTWEELQQARRDGHGVTLSARSTEMERYALYRKHEFWAVPLGQENELDVEYIHALVMNWLIIAYKWARLKAQYTNRHGNVFDRPNSFMSNAITLLCVGILGWSGFNYLTA